MKRELLGLTTVIVATGLAYAVPVTIAWNGPAEAPTPLTAADWNTPGNWEGGSVPNDANTIADLGTYKGLYYVMSAVPVSVWSPKAGTRPGLVYVSEQTFSVCNKSTTDMSGGHWYAPLDIGSVGDRQSFFGKARLCGPIVASVYSTPLLNSWSFFHLDRYAEAAGESRTETYAFTLSSYESFFDLYAPESSATAVVCSFEQTAGSPVLKRIGGSTATVLSVGTAVTGTGIPDGTYLRRVFPNKEWIELSQPVTESAAENDLTFAAFTPNLTVRLETFSQNGSVGEFRFRPCKYRPEDNVVVDVQKFALTTRSGTSDRAIVFDTPFGSCQTDPSAFPAWRVSIVDSPCAETLYPARVVVHSTGSAQDGNAWLGNCDLLLSSNPEGSKIPGFPKAIVRQIPLASRSGAVNGKTVTVSFDESKLTVTGSMTAVVHELTGIWSKLGKYGTGTLLVGMTNSIPSTGTISVQEGTFRIADPDDPYYCVASAEPVEIGSLEVAAGATFAVPARGLRVLTSCTLAPGATISGEGVIMVPNNVAVTGVNFTGNARISTAALGVCLMGTAETAYVPGNPAFWVDCSQTNTLTLAATNGEWGVLRINDVRKKTADDGYNFSTNAAGEAFMPRLHYDDVSGRHFVYFLGNRYVSDYKVDTPTIIDTDTHVWDRPVHDIKAVFQVMSMLRDGTAERAAVAPGLSTIARGGNFLGATAEDRVTNKGGNYINAWGRYLTGYSSPIVEKGWSTSCVTSGDWNVNGLENVGIASGYHYQSYVADGTTIRLVPTVVAYRPPVDATTFPSADSYDHNKGYQNQNKNGNKILCELIVYTNKVSDVERTMIVSHLMKKWQNAEIVVKDVQSDGQSVATLSGTARTALDVAEEDGLVIDGLSESATLAKYGEGRIRIDKVSGSDASLDIRAGKVEIESKTLDKPLLPAGAYAHFDAENLASLTYAESAGVTNVTAWTDARGGADPLVASRNAASTVYPTLTAPAALNGRKVVDFGSVKRLPGSSVDWTQSRALVFPANRMTNNLHTVVALWGSEHGGGNLVGGATGPEMNWSTRYTLVRAGNAAWNLGSDSSTKIVDSKMAIPYTCQLAKAVDFRKGGTACNVYDTKPGGGFDVFSYAGYEAFGMGGFSGIFGSDCYYVGGEQFGEYVAYERKLAPADIADVEAYLKKKWFGTDTPGYDPVVLKNLTVGSGATLKIVGNAPVTVSSLTCAGGTVEGALALAANAGLTATVNAAGAVEGVSVTGDVTFPQSGTVRIVGALDRLQPGTYVLVSAATPIVSAAGWSVDATGVRRRYFYDLSVRDGKLMLTVTKLGMVMIVR